MVTINRQLGKRLQNTSITDYGQGLNRIDMNMAKLDVQPITVDNSRLELKPENVLISIGIGMINGTPFDFPVQSYL